MYCDRCGTKLSEEARVCSSCGKAVGAGFVRGRIAGHVKVLGILWLVHAAFSVLPGLVLLTVFGSVFRPPDIPPFALNFLPLIGGFLLLGGILSALVGVGLLMRQPWARVTALIAAALSLLSIPLGTALGIYTFWVLLPSEHEEEYRSLSHAV